MCQLRRGPRRAAPSQPETDRKWECSAFKIKALDGHPRLFYTLHISYRSAVTSSCSGLNGFARLNFIYHVFHWFSGKMWISKGVYFVNHCQMLRALIWLTWLRWRGPESPTPFVTGSDGGAQTHWAERARRDASDSMMWRRISHLCQHTVSRLSCVHNIFTVTNISRWKLKPLKPSEINIIKKTSFFHFQPQRMNWRSRELYVAFLDCMMSHRPICLSPGSMASPR